MTSFGIHMGNTSVCLAVSKEGKTDVVASPTGDRTTPAVVAFTDSEIVVGLAAKQARLRNMSNTIINNKNVAAGKLSQEWIDSSPVTITQNNNRIYYEVEYKEREWKAGPSDILVNLYKYIHDIAETHSSEVDQCNCVLTVPRDYNEAQRNFVRQAASKAGFKVTQVISETAAACLAYSLGQDEISERYHALVFRSGGISTSMSVVLVSGGTFSILASSDLEMGGDQATEVLVQYLGAEFKQKYKEDILVNKRGKAKLAKGAETVKHVLSTLDTAHCFVESLFDGMDFSSNVTRARFDNQLSKFVSDVLAPISSLLTSVGLNTADIAKVVMAGGTSKIVKLQSALRGKFPNAEILTNYAPDEVIAIGAAVQASYITNETTQSCREKMLSISNHIVAVVEGCEDSMITVLPEDSTVPCKRSVPITAPADQENIDLTVYWGQDKTAALTKLSLDGISNKSKLVLSVHIHRDASTHLTLVDKTSGNSKDVTLKVGS